MSTQYCGCDMTHTPKPHICDRHLDSMSRRTFVRTVYTVEVFTEEPIEDGECYIGALLDDLQSSGEASIAFNRQEQEVNAVELVHALSEHKHHEGPSMFDLNKDGEELPLGKRFSPMPEQS